MKAFAGTLVALARLTGAISACKCFPGDACWPSAAQWDQLNRTVHGRLVATRPLGAPCHGLNFDNATCEDLRAQWQKPGIHMDDSASIMAPFFANRSCDPFTPKEWPCTLGNYVRYAVEVEDPSDVVEALRFAALHDIRFVIRNTGHDYLGRSTGAGALAVWMHRLKNIDFLSWDDGTYSGPAVKVGAGVHAYEAMEAARDQGLVVVGGECPTVGLAGGYTQGGGHSALSTNFGLAADNTLEFEVVTASGEILRASKTENPDLYWALSGGGGGNYAIVLSATLITPQDAHVSGARLSFLLADNPSDAFFAAVNAFHAALPAMIDAGAMAIYMAGATSFIVNSLTGYNKTRSEVEAILAPYISTLESLKITYTVSYSEHATYYDHFSEYFGPLPLGNIDVGVAQYGGRLVPRSVVEQNGDQLGEVVKGIVAQGVIWIGVATNVAPFGQQNTNAVLPAWREALMHVGLAMEWSFDPSDWGQMLANQALMTKTIIPAIEAITPGSGAYINEADFQQPNFQEVFFGSNYDRLLEIKRKYDPDGLFWSLKGVGSEAWVVREDGHMCPALHRMEFSELF
ncbi:FAD-binding domain-containing protein [Thozetella sp. PMI_491]|nr:FAD-binding domain-containing protein [Thozetella sp. PMI_491]